MSSVCIAGAINMAGTEAGPTFGKLPYASQMVFAGRDSAPAGFEQHIIVVMTPNLEIQFDTR